MRDATRTVGVQFDGDFAAILERMALLHLLGSKRTQLNADKETYSTGDRVTVWIEQIGALTTNIA